MEVFYTSKQVAGILGINESSVKRWTNSGMLKCFKTPGGHRKFKKNDILDFAERFSFKIPENVFSVTPAETNAGLNIDKINDVMLKKLLYDNEDEIFDYLNSLILTGLTVTDLFDKVIVSVMDRIGIMWANGELGIEGEHIASGRLTKAIIMLNSKIDSRHKNGLTAFCACLEGEHHELPLVSLSALLKSQGWKVINAGVNLPVDSFISGIRKYNPDLVCLSSTITENPENFYRGLGLLYDAVKEINSKFIIGGNGIVPENTAAKICDYHTADFKSLISYLKINFPAS
jgi:MerR family transcriptional regulator, light-induced transcriptional regulator